jgi:hypothetical protein
MTAEVRTAPDWVGHLLAGPGLVAALCWGVAEGTLFFIVPDLVISLAALYAPRTALRHLFAVVAGSLVAGTGMYLWASVDPAGAVGMVRRVPFVAPAMFDRVGADIANLGAWALCKGPLSGIPYKIYAVLSPGSIPLGAFLLASVPARLERLVVSWTVFSVAGMVMRRPLLRHGALGPILHGLYWVMIYVQYWSRI